MSISQALEGIAIELAGVAIEAGADLAKALIAGKSEQEIIDVALAKHRAYRAVEAIADARVKAKFPDYQP